MVIDLEAVVRLQGVVHRLAKKESASATLRNPSHQAVIDQCKEASRQTVPGFVHSDNMSLLAGPFQQNRGSRFSSASEQGLFYGSRSRKGCLIEGAYYALFFYEGSEYFTSGKTIQNLYKILFEVKIDSESCLQLQRQGNDSLQAKLRHPVNYSFTCAVGARMRAATITCFEYFSARSHQPIIQFGAFSPDVFCSPPLNHVEVTIKISQAHVKILCHDDNSTWEFTRQQYEVNGQLPPPACLGYL